MKTVCFLLFIWGASISGSWTPCSHRVLAPSAAGFEARPLVSFAIEDQTPALRVQTYDGQTEAAQQERRNWTIVTALGLAILASGLAYALLLARRRKLMANAELSDMNAAVALQRAEIEAQSRAIQAINNELNATLAQVSRQRAMLETQQAKISDSIRYASRIQQSILPDEESMSRLPPHFVFYHPMDAVAGDFYWTTRAAGKTFFAVAECAGQGVPGAFLSVLGANLLHQIVDENQIAEPDAILWELNRRIEEALNARSGASGREGMRVALIAFDEKDGTSAEFAGAGLPLWQLRGGRIEVFEGAPHPCGGPAGAPAFKTVNLDCQGGDRLYLLTRGMLKLLDPDGNSAALRDYIQATAQLSLDGQAAAFRELTRLRMAGGPLPADQLLAAFQL